MVSFAVRPSGGGPLATARTGSPGATLPTLRKYGIAASYVLDPRNGDSPSTIRCLVPGDWNLGEPIFPEHRFIGWFTAPNDPSDESGAPPVGASEVSDGVPMDLPLPEMVYACWQHKATVTFDPNLQGASVYSVPELYVGDPLTDVTKAYVTAPSESGASQVGWSANVVHAPSRRLIDVDPDSVQGGISYNTQGAVASGDVYYALWLLPAQVTLDLNASSVDSSFDPSLDGTPGDYYENTLYFYIPGASDPMRDDVRFAFWTRDVSPAASYDPWQSMVAQLDPSMDRPIDGETLYAVWQKAVPARFLGCTDPIVYVFDSDNLPDQLPEPAPGYGPQGAVFDGWQNAATMTDVSAGDTVHAYYVGNDQSYPDEWVLTPKWAYPVTVTFDATTNGGQMPQDWVSPDYISGRAYGTLPVPTHGSLSFAGWYDGNGNLVTASSIVPSSNVTLVAEYASQSYTVDLNGEWRRSGDPRTGDVDELDEGYETQYPPDPGYDGVYESFANWHVVDEVNYSDCPVARMYIDVAGYTEFTVYIRSYGESHYDFCVAMEPDVDLPDYDYGSEVDWWDGTHYDDPWYYIQGNTQELAPEGVDVWSDTPPFGVSDGAQAAGIKATTIGWQTNGTNGLSDYMPVTYQLDGGHHRICIAYKKDSSVNENADRGYVIIPPGGQPL